MEIGFSAHFVNKELYFYDANAQAKPVFASLLYYDTLLVLLFLELQPYIKWAVTLKILTLVQFYFNNQHV